MNTTLGAEIGDMLPEELIALQLSARHAARRVVYNPVDQEDLAQEAMLGWLQSPKVVECPAAYLRTAVTLRGFTLVQRSRKREERLHRWAECNPPRAAEDPADVCVRKEEITSVRVAVEALPPRHKAVVELRLQERTYEEIGAMLKMNITAVKQIMRQAMEILRRALADER